jgi:hypothetical protein
MYLESIKRGSVKGLGILSAVLGAQKDHPWIARILCRYQSLQFPKDLSLLPRFIISGLIADVSAELFGFKFLPVYQRLKDDVHIYPPDVFYSRAGEENLVRYSCHMCASSWREPDVTSIGRRAMNLLLRH